MKRFIALIALSATAAFIILGQSGCADKANAANNAPGVEKQVNGGQNKKTGQASGFVTPQ